MGWGWGYSPARINSVQWPASLASTLAPESRANLTISSWLASTAKWAGVIPLQSVASSCAFLFNRMRAEGRWP